MLTLGYLDVATVVLYLVACLAVGAWLARRAGGSEEDFFLSGRTLPWWLVGTSMVATTFALDTPLFIAQTVVGGGLYANWIWLALGISHLFVTFFLAGRWRRAGVVTDAELCELRYGGRPAAVLRGCKGFFFAFVMNGLTLGVVFFAVKQICYGFGLDQAPPPGAAEALASRANLILAACVATALLYSVTSGLWGVVATDLIQFVLAMVGAIVVASLALAHPRAGGLAAVVAHAKAMGGRALALAPEGLSASGGLASPRLSLGSLQASDEGLAFLCSIAVMWWAWKFADGGGVLIQRMSAAKDERHATLGTLWFCVCHYVLRWWPWALVGLAALPVLDVAAVADDPAARAALANQAYARMVVEVVPEGLRGLVLAYFAAAFMSTVDTHLNLGSAYLVNDVYRRFVVRDATERHYVWVGRLGCAVIVVLGFAASHLTVSFTQMLAFILNLVAGAGSVFLLRWFWWRVNAWSELSALAASLAIGGGLQLFAGWPSWAVTVTNVLGSGLVWVSVTFLTAPVAPDRLESFYRRTRPLGAWGPVERAAGMAAPPFPASALIAWLCAVAATYGSLVGVRDLIAGPRPRGAALLAACALLAGVALRHALRATRGDAAGGADPARGAE